ncbi:MAG: clan AA aspartic protease [Bergeyella sp.]
MGVIYSDINVSNPVDKNIKPFDVKCLVDSGATYFCIPEHISVQLGLNELEKREVILADGSSKLVSYVGPVKLQFENRTCFVGALVLGDQCLLGAIPMEDMDLIIHPKLLKLSVNPASPNIASGLAM